MSDKRSKRIGFSAFERAASGVEADEGAIFANGGETADVWLTQPAASPEQSNAIMNGMFGTPERSASELEAENLQLQQLATPKFAISETGVEVIGNVTEQDVIEKIREMTAVKNADYWGIGDLLAFAQDQKWGNVYTEAERITGKKYQTLADYVWVARSIHFSLRKEKGLTLNHFKLLTAFKPTEQQQWIRRVQRDKWSVSQLKAAINGDTVPAAASAPKGWQKIEHAILKTKGIDKHDLAERLRALADQLERNE